MNTPILTGKAKQHISSVCEDRDVYAMTLNLKGGGCAGFEYVWDICDREHVKEEDIVLECGDGNLVIGADSIPFLEGTEIDYHTEMFGSKLVIRNPNVQSACGCGESIGF